MSIEDRLRRELRQRAALVEPSEPQWERIASRLEPDGATEAPRPRPVALLVSAAAIFAVALVLTGLAITRRPGHRVQVVAGTSVTSSPGRPGANTASTARPNPAQAPSESPVTGAGGRPVGPAGGPVPKGFDPVSVTWISTAQGWVLGTAPCGHPPCTSILRTRDGGRTWRGVPAPKVELAGVGAGAAHIRFADAANGWLFGPSLWATHDGGVSWREVTGLGGPIMDLEAASHEAFALALSGVGGGAAHLFASATNHDSWMSVGPQAIEPSAALTLLGTTGYTVGTGGTVLAFTSAGLDPRGRPCAGVTGAQLGSVSAGDGSGLAALCVSGPALGSSTKNLVVSGDGGRTWSVAGTAPRGGQPTGLAQALTGAYVIAANSGASELYRSADGGRTWSTAYQDISVGGAPFHDLGFTTPSRGTVVLAVGSGQSRLLMTTDGGVTWQADRLGS